MHFLSEEMLVLKCQICQISLGKLLRYEAISEPCENYITCECFKQSYIEAHSLQFYLQYWQLCSEH